MKQSEIKPLFVDSSDAALTPGDAKLLFRATIFVNWDGEAKLTYECYPVHKETPNGYWIRGRNGSFDREGAYKPALAFTKKHPNFGKVHDRNTTHGFAQETKELARRALAMRLESRISLLEVERDDTKTKLEKLKERYPGFALKRIEKMQGEEL